MIFKLNYPSGKTFLTREFGDKRVIDGFGVVGKKIVFVEDVQVEVAEYATVDRAFEVYDEIVNAYNANHSFTLPEV